MQIEDIHVDSYLSWNLSVAEQPPYLKPLIQKKVFNRAVVFLVSQGLRWLRGNRS